MRRLGVVITLLAFVGGPSAAETHRRADVEFSFKPMVSAQAKRTVALALWRTGEVEAVSQPDKDGRLYRVYLHDPSNLLEMQHVQHVLEAQDGVLYVASIAGWLFPQDRDGAR